MAHDLERELIERTVESATRTGRSLQAALDPLPLWGGRIDDTWNLIGRRGRRRS